MESDIVIKKSNKLTLFNPAFIDDYGFTPEEFRVFARIMRRAASNGCSESIANMAHSLNISERLVRRAFRVLLVCGAITRTERKGKTDLLDFQTCDKWEPAENLKKIRLEIDAEFKKSDRERKQKNTRPLAETQPLTPCGNATTPLAETQPPVVAETQPKGTQVKGTPLKVIATPTPTNDGFPDDRSDKHTVPNPQEPDERMRFFPFLERSGLAMQTMNELCELFSHIAAQQGRRTLIKESEWLDQCNKLFVEGMTTDGIKSLYRYCREIAGQEVITPKVMDWKFSEYKQFLAKQQGVAA